MLCKYKDIFGKVGEGLHSYRLFNIAIVDVISTIFVAYLLKIYIFPQRSFLKLTIILFLLGIILHRIFCVKTTLDKMIFG
jgi:hypothetical protein|tara:strand:+ start:1111 stop:1350 length:240 start_codon:yes stop_codon:yes gene_type:complete